MSWEEVAPTAMTSYRAIFERDARGVWLVSVPRVRGCHSYGRSLEEARRNIREALALFVDDADTVRLREDVRIPTGLARAVREVRAARRRAEAEQAAATAALRRIARTLTRDAGLSLRDAGDLLGLSRQRVQQLTGRR